MTPRRVKPGEDHAALLQLIQTSFAYMEGRIDPPSSMHLLSLKNIAEHAEQNEIWVIEQNDAPIACIFLTVKPDTLYLGKLAVNESSRNKGLARALATLAENRARDLGKSKLELESRVELVENHAAFAAMGFGIVGETAHPGYQNATSYTLQKPIKGTLGA
ncbi:GNAT family N-acetyltransferase [Pseudohalocynthiibacter aestuariivivens]|uniref:GNAT family N-acetyltransferase n=1 Tax=Pseudohalocynthiibacter aestuariivivens TaxID=1591409 RepID=A0ABV5JHJ6_9RHOB|nr:GNAT family N-acetyltransferase [Pseudohalocynthiibacter aestuariivivens]MBS9715429.1 GNAT family N-acetyltransferase [Pseudohalocynthiibacter aestuariivivens]